MYRNINSTKCVYRNIATRWPPRYSPVSVTDHWHSADVAIATVATSVDTYIYI